MNDLCIFLTHKKKNVSTAIMMFVSQPLPQIINYPLHIRKDPLSEFQGILNCIMLTGVTDERMQDHISPGEGD